MRLSHLFSIALLAAFYPFASATAAPQTLLLVAQNDDLVFQCLKGDCIVEASGLCLQYDRATPTPGTPYEVVDEGRYGTGREDGLSLIGRTAGGAEKELSLEDVKIASERDHMAIRFVVPKALLDEHGLASVALRVTHNVVLAPVWHPGDPKPQLEDDLYLSMGPQRTVAERSLAANTDPVVATEILRDTLNNMPRGRVASKEERDAAFALAVEKRRIRRDGDLPESSLAQANKSLKYCDYINDEDMWFRGYYERVSRYRGCLSQRHDSLIKSVNQTYWKAFAGTGS